MDSKDLKVFLSFPGKSTQFAHRLRRAINAWADQLGVGLQVFFSETSLFSGEDWELQIREALKQADFVIVLWTPHSPSSIGQLLEVGAAWWQEKRMIPVIMGVVVESLPPMLSRYQVIRWANLEKGIPQALVLACTS